MIVELLKTLLVWAFLFPAIYTTGRRCIKKTNGLSPTLHGIFCSAIGMAVLSLSAIPLSYLHLLTHRIIWGLILALFLTGYSLLPEWLAWVRSLGSFFKEIYLTSLLSKVLSVVFIISFFVALLASLSPELGGDALCYQLNLPKLFLSRHSIAPLEYDFNSFFPMLMNHLYLIGLATGGVFAAKCFHLFCGVLLFLSIELAVVRSTKNKTLALFLALAVWLSPAFFNTVSTTYIDIGLAFYTFLALYVLIEALSNDSKSLFYWSGFFLGCALSIKYLALYAFAAFLMVWLNESLNPAKRSRLFSAFAIWMLGCFLAGGFWLIRNHIVTGNPFFPYFGEIFGRLDRPPSNHRFFGMGKGLMDFLSLFWNMAVHPTSFGSFTTRIGVIFFPLFWSSILSFSYVKESRRYGLFFLTFLGIWFYLGQLDRWLIPALPALAVTSAFGLVWLNRSPSKNKLAKLMRGVAIALGVFILLGDFVAGIYHYRHVFNLYGGRWNKNEYLKKMERTIGIAEWVNQNLPKNAHILLESETRQFYFDRDLIRNTMLQWKTHYDQEASPEKMSVFLKSLGVSHILLSHPLNAQSQPSALLSLTQTHHARLVHSMTSENIYDAVYQYEIFQLL